MSHRACSDLVAALILVAILPGCLYEADFLPAGTVLRPHARFVGVWSCTIDEGETATLRIGIDGRRYALSISEEGKDPELVVATPLALPGRVVWSVREPDHRGYSFAEVVWTSQDEFHLGWLGDGKSPHAQAPAAEAPPPASAPSPDPKPELTPATLAHTLASRKLAVVEIRTVCRRSQSR